MAASKPSAFFSGLVLNGWMPVMFIGCCTLLLACIPGALAELRYERLNMMMGQPWRALSAHVVHLDKAHWFYNFLGLVLIHELLWADMPVRHGAGLALSAALGISGALCWLQPEIAWYAGSSGVLHGLWAGCALAGCLRTGRSIGHPGVPDPVRRKWTPTGNLHMMQRHLTHPHICIAALAALAVKLHGDMLPGIAVTTGTGGLPVVPSAHLYGALTGAIYVIVWRGWGQLMQHARAK